MSEVTGWPERITEIRVRRLSKLMSSFNPYDPPRAKNDDSREDDPPPAATGIIRAIPIAILISIWVSTRWRLPWPSGRALRLRLD
jgi:hypothetical protein